MAYSGQRMRRSKLDAEINCILVGSCKNGQQHLRVVAAIPAGKELVAHGEPPHGVVFGYTCPGCTTKTCSFKVRPDWRERVPCYVVN